MRLPWAHDVIRRIEMYVEGGLLRAPNGTATKKPPPVVIPVSTAKKPLPGSSRGAGVPHVMVAQTEVTMKSDPPVTSFKIQEIAMWEKLPGQAHEITAGADGTVWCLGMHVTPKGNSIHRWASGNWEQIDGAATKIAAAPGGTVWTIGRDHLIFSRADSRWTPRPGLAREIAIGANGAIWCISSADSAPGGGSIHFWNGRDWDHVEGAATKIAVGPDDQPWIVNSAGQIFRRSGEGWELLPGLAQELALGCDGSAWCLSRGVLADGGHSIHRWNGADWDDVEGSAAKISVGHEGTAFVVNSEQSIFRMTCGHLTTS